MANICSTFGQALENSLSTIALYDLINSKQKIDEGLLRSLSLSLLLKTNQKPYKNDNKLKEIIFDAMEDDLSSEDWYEKLTDDDKEQLASKILDNIVEGFNKYKYLLVEFNPKRDKDLPLVSNSISELFIGDNTAKLFARWFNSKLLHGVLFYNNSFTVKTISDLNTAIRELKQQFVNTLCNYLGRKNPITLYKDLGINGNKLNVVNYNLLIEEAKARFSERLSNGKYLSAGNVEEDHAYYSYITLLNFDRLINNSNFDGVITIANTGQRLINSNEENIYKIPKYTFSFSNVINQRWDEDLSKDSDEINKFVRKVIENTQLYEVSSKNKFTEIPDQYLSYRNFKEVLRILKENNRDYATLRNNPYSISELFEEAYKSRNSIFSGINAYLKNTFVTMYYKFFSKKYNSLATLSEFDGTVSDFDIYGLILNQINKTSFTNYSQYIYDPETKETLASILDSAEINKRKYQLEKNIMSNSAYKTARETILNKWNVEFIEISETGETSSINYYKGDQTIARADKIVLSNNGNKIEINIGKSNNPQYRINGDTEAANIKDELLGALLKDFLFLPIDKDYIRILKNVTGSQTQNTTDILDLVTASILNMNVMGRLDEDPRIITLTSSYPNIKFEDANTNSWKYFNSEIRAAKLSGFFRALQGLELIATVQSIINGDSVKSNVTDANGNKLQKERLTCLTNDDYNLFSKLRSEIDNDLSLKRTCDSNIFMNRDILKRTELKTLYNSYYKQDPVKVNKASDVETNYIAFVHDFLTRNDEISVQPTVYSDKSTIWNKVIDLKVKLNMSWVPDKFKGKTLDELSADDIRELKFISTKGMAEAYLQRVNKDYELLVSTSVFKDKPEISENSSEFEKYKEYIQFFRQHGTRKNIYDALIELKHTKGKMPTILEEIHFTSDFTVNPSLYSFFKLYNNNDRTEYDILENINRGMYALKLKDSNSRIELSYNNGKQIKEIHNGIKSKLKSLGYSDDPNETDKKQIEDYNKEWIDKDSNELILYKVEEGSLTEENVINNKVKVVLNPILEKFLALDNFISYSYNALVYGLPYIHPAKGNKAKSLAEKKKARNEKNKTNEIIYESDYLTFDRNDILVEDAARTNASYKRAVIGGATIHTWLKNKPEGIPSKLKLAVIEDPEERVYNIQQTSEDKITMYDGAIWMDPFYAIWEANSVAELNQSITHRKPIGYFSLANYLSSGLAKCATYSLNNFFIRNSIGKNDAERMLKKMADEKWITPVGLTFNNIKFRNKNNSTRLKDNAINYINPRYKDVIVNEDGTQTVVFKEITGLKHVESRISLVTDESTNEKLGDFSNFYDVTIVTTDVAGNAIKTETIRYNINSNYTLWKLLGGAKSVDINGKYSEASIETVANLASKLVQQPGSDLDNLYEKLLAPLKEKYPTYMEKWNNIRSELKDKEYIQPLKLSDINFLANHSAIKNGAANMLSTASYYNDDELTYIEIDPNFMGAQMSAEHFAEDSEVSEMTQVISALIQKGVSYNTALSIYKDIGTYIAEGLKPYMDATNPELVITLGKQLVKAFATGDLGSENLASRYIALIKEDLLNKNVSFDTLIPFDDPSIFKKFVIDFANGINQEVIRRKFFGLNAVLNPSHDVIGLIEYDNKLYTKEEYENISGIPAIANIPNTEVDPGQIQFGDWVYDDGIIKQVSANPAKMKDNNVHITLSELRSKYRAKGEKVSRINSKGRNLRAQNFTFEVEGKGFYDGFDLDSSKFSYELEGINNLITEVNIRDGIVVTSLKDGVEEDNLSYKRLVKFIEFVSKNKSLTSGSVESLVENINAYVKDGNKQALKQLRLRIGDWIISDCRHIEENKEFPSLVEWNSTEEYIPLHGEVKYSANEMMLPKVWASKYKIRENDNLGTILEDPETFFRNRLDSTDYYADLFDNEYAVAVLKGSQGNKDVYVVKDIKSAGDTATKLNTERKFIKGKLYHVLDGMPLVPAKKGVTLYQVGDDIVAEVKNLENLNSLEDANNFEETVILKHDNDIGLVKAIYKSRLVSKAAKQFISEDFKNLIKNKKEIPADIEIENVDFSTIYIDSDEVKNEKAKRMAISFKNAALNFIVARIPAQSMQSFMNMTIKGFINTTSNVVYVCEHQLLYQGSDYKIYCSR